MRNLFFLSVILIFVGCTKDDIIEQNAKPSDLNIDQIELRGAYSIFGAEDHWLWGLENGKCGPYTGQGVGSDAAIEIANELNDRMPNQLYTHFTEIEEIIINDHSGLFGESTYYANDFPNPNDPTPNDNIRDWLIYDAFGNGCLGDQNYVNQQNSMCFSPDDMNYYYHSLVSVINQVCPLGKAFVDIEMLGDFAGSLCISHSYHSIKIRFGYGQTGIPTENF